MVLTTLLLGRAESADVLVGGLQITCYPAALATYIKSLCNPVQWKSEVDFSWIVAGRVVHKDHIVTRLIDFLI